MTGHGSKSYGKWCCTNYQKLDLVDIIKSFTKKELGNQLVFYLDHSWSGKWVDQAEKICKNEDIGKAGDFGKSIDALVIYAFC